jgi:hypothetical protein
MTITRISCKHPFFAKVLMLRAGISQDALMAVEIISPYRRTYDAAHELDAEPGDGIGA